MRGLIFDVDGTLVTLNVDGDKMRTKMAEELNRLGFDISFIAEGVSSQEIIDRAKLQVELGRVEADFEKVRAALYQILDELELQWNAKSEPIRGVEEVLSRLKETHRGLALATLTNSGRKPSELLLKKHGLIKYFDFTFSRDELPFMKPRPEAILHALEVMRLEKEAVLYVGDSVVDVRAARSAGVRIAAVPTGRYPSSRLREEGADLVLGSLSEVLGLLG